MKVKINALSGSEAKTILLQLYARMDIVKNGNGEYSSERCIDDTIEVFNGIAQFIEKRNGLPQ
jgi:hypothetical protein